MRQKAKGRREKANWQLPYRKQIVAVRIGGIVMTAPGVSDNGGQP